jgi:RNA polymerase sigma factor (sigma-70 family)
MTAAPRSTIVPRPLLAASVAPEAYGRMQVAPGSVERSGLAPARDAAMTHTPTGLALPEPAPIAGITAAPLPAEDGPAQAELAALVQRIVYQDEAALAALYRSLCARVHRQALRLIRDAATAEEVVEDVFWQVWRQAPRFDATRGPVIAWVLQMTRSRSLDALRAMGRDPLRDALDIDDGHGTEPAAEHADPQAQLGQAQLAAQIELALCALDPLRRQLVSLAFQRGYSQSEIAVEMGLPLGTVKSHLRRALAEMKLFLELSPPAARRLA